jgi:hypothetical protein
MWEMWSLNAILHILDLLILSKVFRILPNLNQFKPCTNLIQIKFELIGLI